MKKQKKRKSKALYYSKDRKAYSLLIYQGEYFVIHKVGRQFLKAYTPLRQKYYTKYIGIPKSWKEYDNTFLDT